MTSTPKARFYWLVPAAFLAHCAEELPRFPRWATRHFGTTTTQFYLASHAILVPSVLSAGACGANRPTSRRAAFFATSVAAALGINGVFHIATTRLFGEYSPGVITGAAAVLPAAVYTLLRTKRDNLLTEEQILGAFLTGTALSTGAIASLYVDMPRLGGTVTSG
ncbi:HXXEE domain-containing protein [Mycobacterium sp. NPDC050041]|uniref:HXXEE domain-containing protein n=1 Tax=Mycobacterium sp. NPDC050041 TaxID=3364293 RepID=UPI003C30AC89